MARVSEIIQAIEELGTFEAARAALTARAPEVSMTAHERCRDEPCPYCRAMVIADDGPDDWTPYHFDPRGSEESAGPA